MSRYFFSSLLLAFFMGVSSVAQGDAPQLTVERSGFIDELSARDQDVREVIELVARKGGLNVISGPGVSGKVTIILRNVDAREALRTVLESCGLAYSEDGSILRVMTAEDYSLRYGRSFGRDKVTRVIGFHYIPVQKALALLQSMKSESGRVIVDEATGSLVITDDPDKVRAMEEAAQALDIELTERILVLKYARAEDVFEAVRDMVTRSVGSVQCDVGGNRLIVNDSPSSIERIRRAVEREDARSRRVILEGKLVHIILDDEHLGGVDWAGILDDYRNLRLRGRYDFLDGDSQDRVLSLGAISNGDFEPLLEALETVGDVREYPLSNVRLNQSENARVTVHFDEPALGLVSSKDEPFVRSGQAAAIDFDVRLSVDPQGQIGASVILSDPGQEQLPFSKASAGALEFSAGSTVVLGGLIATEKIATIRKIPLMGDLPIFGFAFRYRNSAVQREEFVVFLTPRLVVRDDVSSDTGEILEKTEVLQKGN